MKKLFTLFLIFGLIISTKTSIGNSIYGKYGIQEYKSVHEYKQYIGQTVMYLSTLDGSRIERGQTFTGKKNTEYIITKISGSKKRVNMHLVEKNGKLKARMDVSYNPKLINGFPSIPLLLVDKFREEKNGDINKKFFNKESSEEYTCIDVDIVNKHFGNNNTKPYPQICYILKSNSTEAKIEVPITQIYAKEYSSGLKQVIKPENENIRYGKTETVSDSGVTKYRYSDNIIDIFIFEDGEKFIFDLKNVSENSIKIIWDEAVFVDFDGKSSRIIHNGVKYSQKDEAQQASIIISGASIDEIAIPTANIEFVSMPKLRFNEWIVNKIYPRSTEPIIGQLKLMLPIQIKNTVNEYIFVFNVDYIYKYPIEKTHYYN